MASNIQKIIGRTEEKISNGQYYEAHQSVRTLTTRYIRAKNYDDAIELLQTSSSQLLAAGQEGSASDLILYLVEVLTKAEKPVDSASRARLAQLVKQFNPAEPTLKKIAAEAIAWSIKAGSDPQGDRELHHVFGSIFASADEAYEAEKHLIQGTGESGPVLAKLLFDWSQEDADSRNAGLYMARGVLGYLAAKDIKNAKKFSQVFLENLSTKIPPSSTQSLYDTTIPIFEGHPVINFMQLLIVVCQSKSTDLFKKLRARYKYITDEANAFNAPLAIIGREYFGIEPPQNNNMLQNLMASLMGPTPA